MQCKVKIFFVLCSVAFCSGEDFGEPVNVALNKASNQSSIFSTKTGQEFPAENGVDGNNATCINTKNENAPWWEVDLGHIFPILNITIYARPGYFDRLAFSDIFLDGQLCTTIGSQITDNPISLQCNHTMYGQKLKIIRKSPNFLNFCDFQVWVPQFISVCDAGKYGSDCNLNCPQNCIGGPNNSVCHLNTGTCYGCSDDRYGRMCEESCESMKCFGKKCDQDNGQCLYCNGNFKPPACTECRDTYYGSKCSQDCHWYKYCFGSKTCNTTTGYCDSCIAGRMGTYCYQECNPGYFGEGCTKECGHCRNKAACNKSNGHCMKCKIGYTMPLCKDECNNGTYGEDCKRLCGQCKDGKTCNAVTGQCFEGCSSGWEGILCDQTCKNRTYGQECKEKCGQCENGAVCNSTTGHCVACTPGLKMPRCRLECTDRTYGRNCGKSCGRCVGRQPCNVKTGECVNGCEPGWTNKTCDMAAITENGITENAGSVNPIIIGTVVAIVAVLVVIIVVIIIVNQKRTQPRKNEYVNVPADPTRITHQATGRDNSGFNLQTLVHAPNNIKPKAEVLPQIKDYPVGLHYNESGVVYENIPGLTDVHQCQSTTEQNKMYETSENEIAHSGAKKPPRKTKPGQQIITIEDNAVQQKSNENVSHFIGVIKGKLEIAQDPERLDEVSDDYDDVDNDDLVYLNETSNPNFKPPDVRVSMLQNYLFDSLKGQQLEDEFSKLPPKMIHDHACGKREENHFKNRFNSILPYDNTRVILDKLEYDSSSDYINANYIQGYNGMVYIAAQGPKDNTVADFWRMVWQKRVEHIVMLTNVLENTKPKCHEYWPAEGAKHTSGEIEVEGLDEQSRAHYVIRTFEIKNVTSSQKRTVKQFHYVSWFDHDVPRAVDLVDFWRFVKSQACKISAPPLVHCSAGVGRTGTYLALDIIMDQAQHEKEVNIYGTVRRMRDDRCTMVQNKKQYRFLHEAILEAYTSTNTRFQSSIFNSTFPHKIRFNSPDDRIDNEYQILEKMQRSLPRPSYTVSTREENRLKNRGSHVLPDDKHLVYLTPYVIGRSQYINAVYMSTFLDPRGCILTQRPLADTVMDIWRLIDGCGIAMVVSIMTLDEDKEEACRYWPQQDGGTLTTGIYTVTLKSMEQVGSSLSCYTLELQSQEKTRDVRVLRYTDWTHEIPGNIPELLQLIETLQSNTSARGRNPILVQCNDGVSKSGLMCALWEIITRMVHNNEIDVYLTVRKVQSVRLQAVNTLAQYRFCYEIVQKYRDAASVYANI